jgi:branched-subunit amino acid ABC-type transport system permease component
VLFLIASGLSLIWGVMGVINFSHGSLYMLGAFASYTVVRLLAPSDAGFWVALALAPLAVAAFGGLIEVLLLRRIYVREHYYQVLLTYGLLLAISDLVKWVWGPGFKSFFPPSLLNRSVTLLGHPFAIYPLFIITLGVIVALCLWLVLSRTRLGWMVRASSADREMASALGINVPWVFTGVFVLGSWLAGLAGVLIAPSVAIAVGMDLDILAEAFVVVIIGGLGSFWGALLGAIIIGETYAFGIIILPQWAMLFMYLAMIIILLGRPQGLFGRAVR